MDSSFADKVTLSILAAVSFSMLAWDYCLLLPVEYQIYFLLKKTRRDPRPWLFIFLRYTGIVALLANMIMSSVQHQHCHAAAEIYYGFSVLVMFCFCALVTLRVSIIWDYHPDVVTGLGFLGLGVTGIWIAVATQIKPFSQSDIPLGISNCSLQPFPSWFSATFAAVLAFNMAAVTLIIIKALAKQKTPERDVGREFKLLSFLVICGAASAVTMVITALGPENQIAKQATSGFFIFLIAVTGSRIYFTFVPGELTIPLFQTIRRAESQGGSLSYPSWAQASSSINQPGLGFSAISHSRAIASGTVEYIEVQAPPAVPLLRPPSHHDHRVSAVSNSTSLAIPDGNEQTPGRTIELQSPTPVPVAPAVPENPVPKNVLKPPAPSAPSASPQQPETLTSIIATAKQTNPPPPDNGPSNQPLRSNPKTPKKKQKRISEMKSGWVDE